MTEHSLNYHRATEDERKRFRAWFCGLRYRICAGFSEDFRKQIPGAAVCLGEPRIFGAVHSTS